MSKEIKYAVMGAIALLVLSIGFACFYTVEEGHVGIVKRFGEAQKQVDPGLHFKVPFMDSVQELEVRTRKSELVMPSATAEQMPVSVTMSVNWTVNKDSALDLFKKYGGLQQFEDRILDPRFNSATKTIIPRNTAEQLIQDRSIPRDQIELLLIETMSEFPVVIDTVQIVNVGLPGKYLESIETKQREKNLAEAETHKLNKQNLIAQQAVNTANANRDAAMAKADGTAYRITTEATAEAEAIIALGIAKAKAIEAQGKALKNNPLVIDLTEAERWNGELPNWVTDSTPLPVIDAK